MLETPHQLGDAVRNAVRAELTALLSPRFYDKDIIPRMASDALIGLGTVCVLTDLSRPQIWRGVAAGTFPRPLAPSAGRRAWLLSEIQLWIADRKAERDAGTSGRRSPQLTAVG